MTTKRQPPLLAVNCKTCSLPLGVVIAGAAVYCRKCRRWTKAELGANWCKPADVK